MLCEAEYSCIRKVEYVLIVIFSILNLKIAVIDHLNLIFARYLLGLYDSRVSEEKYCVKVVHTGIFLLIYFQQDAPLHSLFISGKLLYIFRVVSTHHKEHTTVSTVSGTCQTVTAPCRYSGR